MLIIKIYTFIFFLLILSSCLKLETNNENNVPKAINGIIDLRKWDFNSESVELKGEWDFYWNTFLNPDELNKTKVKPLLFNFPNNWNNYKINNKSLSSTGNDSVES